MLSDRTELVWTMTMSGNGAAASKPNTTGSSPHRVFHGMFLGSDKGDEEWISLPAQLPPSLAEKNAEEYDLRLRNGLLHGDFFESVLRRDSE